MSSTNGADHVPIQSRSYSSPPPTLVLIIIVLTFVFVGFFILFFCKCFFQNFMNSRTNPQQRNSSPRSTAAVNPTSAADDPGLDAAIVNTLPTCTYATVKQYRKAKYGLECAICLLEFEDDHVLRLIRICFHVFHQECIDLWFQMHKTCPVCRRNLELLAEGTPAGLTPGLTPGRTPGQETDDLESRRDSVSITIKDDLDFYKATNSEEKAACSWDKSEFARCNTTGHSIFLTLEEEDKFTLRLPDHVTQELIKANHWPKHPYKSCELRRAQTPGEGPSRYFNYV